MSDMQYFIYLRYRYTQHEQVPNLQVLACSLPSISIFTSYRPSIDKSRACRYLRALTPLSPYLQTASTSPEPAGTRVLFRLHFYVYVYAMQCGPQILNLDST